MRNIEVSNFLDNQKHPLRAEIDYLRDIILNSNSEIEEKIKWNSPNYVILKEDRFTLKIFPQKQIQLIFHRGAKKLDKIDNRLIKDPNNLLTWKENDRALVSFKNLIEIEKNKRHLMALVNDWIDASKF